MIFIFHKISKTNYKSKKQKIIKNKILRLEIKLLLNKSRCDRVHNR